MREGAKSGGLEKGSAEADEEGKALIGQIRVDKGEKGVHWRPGQKVLTHGRIERLKARQSRAAQARNGNAGQGRGRAGQIREAQG